MRFTYFGFRSAYSVNDRSKENQVNRESAATSPIRENGIQRFRPDCHMTLHELIERLLREAGRMLSTRELADLVNDDGSYVKRDKTRVTDFQIHGRTRNYPSIFVRDGSLVGLREWDRAANQLKIDVPVQSESIPRLEIVEEHVDVSMITYLEETGFEHLGTVGELLRSGLPTNCNLQRCGVYAITLPTGFTPCFLTSEEASEKGNVIRPRQEDYLRQKWVKDVDVVYYGIAGLRSWLAPNLWSNRSERILGCLLFDSRGFVGTVT